MTVSQPERKTTVVITYKETTLNGELDKAGQEFGFRLTNQTKRPDPFDVVFDVVTPLMLSLKLMA